MKPFIVCHIMQSVDGRIACDMVDKISGNEYYTALDSFKCQAFIEGKHSYEIHYCGFEHFAPKDATPIGECKVYVHAKSEKYSVTVDTRGTLLWDKTDNESRISLLSEHTPKEYLDYLESKGISYIVVGKEHIDLPQAMEMLHDHFDVKRVAVVGGGKIDGAFLQAGLLDEVSAMIAPGIDGRMGQPANFDTVDNNANFLPYKLRLREVSTVGEGVIWTRYTVL